MALRVCAGDPVLLVLLASASTVWGQATTSLRGTAMDPTGGAVSGATVTITSTESKIERKATTSEDEAYQFTFIPPGTYTMRVAATGIGDESCVALFFLNADFGASTQLLVSLDQALETETTGHQKPKLLPMLNNHRM